jgi:hypothetical protein
MLEPPFIDLEAASWADADTDAARPTRKHERIVTRSPRVGSE